MNKIKYYFYEKKRRHLEGSAGGHSILHIWEFSFTCHKTKQGANWIGASSRLCASFSCCPPEDPEDLDLEDYTPKRFFSLKTTQGGLEFVSWSTGSIPEYKDCLVFFKKKKKKNALSCSLMHCDVSRTPRLNYSFAFNQESCIILCVIHHRFPTAQKTEWQQYTQWASTWGALNLSIIRIVLRKILLCGKSRMEQPFQWPAEALKLFPIKCANSEATEFSHHLLHVLGIWFGLNQKNVSVHIKRKMIIGCPASHI